MTYTFIYNPQLFTEYYPYYTLVSSLFVLYILNKKINPAGNRRWPPARRGTVPPPSCGHRNCHLSVPSARGAATAKSRPGRCRPGEKISGFVKGCWVFSFFWFEACGVVWRNWGIVWGVVWGVVFFFFSKLWRKQMEATFPLRTLFWLRSFSRSWGRWWVWQHQIL